jgi:D-tyrosyl-tRNA(Tyr) deacylase
MKALLQRVTHAGVTVEGRKVAEAGRGLLVLLGVGMEDSHEDASYLANKVATLRIFPDEDGRFNRSVLDIGGDCLVVSQFTLLADTRKGRRPSFTAAAPPDQARELYEAFVSHLRSQGLAVATGVFQEHMMVEIHNDGPVTVLLESKPT